jgi:hypothetical protein
LSGDDKKQFREIPALALDAHLRFAHRLQQRRLRARRGAVDFVGEQNVREHRAFVKMELLVALAENGNAEDVRRQQIGRELEALELRVNRAGERLGQRRLARARKIIQQHVAAAGERGEQLSRRAGLAAHDFGDVPGDVPAGFPRGFKMGRCHGRFWKLKQRKREMVSASFHGR